ncbi:unnamed protein product [Urochloa decumbens]|uniref:Protein kinase domain-containing protein n=1 Tax=Urochloa decumbens TaxID=240449 RepID=A0ABC9AS74_9POAL
MGRSSMWTLLLLLLLPTAGTSRLTIQPGCQASCGGVDVPYPFGIGAGCFRAGFEIACVKGTLPVLAGTSPAVPVLSLSVMPRPEARVMLPVGYQCYNKTGEATDDFSCGTVDLNPAGVYRISNTYNELFVLGCFTTGYTNSGPRGRYRYMFYAGCLAYCNDSRSARDGECAGIGCCHVDIPPGLTDNKMKFESGWTRHPMEFSPCDYGFIVEKGAYSFRVADLQMDVTQASMPLRLDWAIRDSTGSSMSKSCAQAANNPGYSCKSDHSECVDSTNGPGYVCNCTKGYEGNPYLKEGCTNMNECERSREEFPCHGECHDTEGSYDCRCHLGYESHGDPKENPCNPKFPLPAKLTLGTVVVTSIIVVALLSVAITSQKRQLFRKNGGNILKNVDNLVFFTEREVKEITGNYGDLLGKGSFGDVYRGTLKDKTQVAVKRSSAAVDKDKVITFVREVEIQSRMIHKNVLRLKGCCLEVKFPVLVYEYAAKGSLGDIIHGEKNGQMVPFPLEQRLDIAIGSAEGLAYMHTYTESIIQHGDVKPDNILLDYKFIPKLSDFGLSKLLAPGKQYVDQVVGCLGYMDPAYVRRGRLTPANDVYSFGVVLLELITRKPIIPGGCEGEECKLVTEFRQVYDQENRRREMLDKDIATEEDISVLEEIGKLAIECLAEENRPDMTEVARRLAMLKNVWKQGNTSSQSDYPLEEIAADGTLNRTTSDPLLLSASQRALS